MNATVTTQTDDQILGQRHVMQVHIREKFTYKQGIKIKLSRIRMILGAENVCSSMVQHVPSMRGGLGFHPQHHQNWNKTKAKNDPICKIADCFLGGILYVKSQIKMVVSYH